jgi:Tfp pilus assembly protein PilN
MAHFIDIDFARPRPRRRASMAAVALFIAGLVAIGVLVVEYLEARDDLQRLETRQARLLRAPRPDTSSGQRQASTESARARDAALARMAVQLQLPWDGLLRILETATDQTVAVLSIDAQGTGRTLRMVGEAKSMADVVAYVARLRTSALVSAATLSHHEEVPAGGSPMIRFSVELAWGGAL